MTVQPSSPHSSQRHPPAENLLHNMYQQMKRDESYFLNKFSVEDIVDVYKYEAKTQPDPDGWIRAARLILRENPKAAEAAIELLNLAIETKSSEAAITLACVYLGGQGVDKDFAKAVDILRKDGSSNACKLLVSYCLKNGNKETAEEVLMECVAKEYPWAFLQLGLLDYAANDLKNAEPLLKQGIDAYKKEYKQLPRAAVLGKEYHEHPGGRVKNEDSDVISNFPRAENYDFTELLKDNTFLYPAFDALYDIHIANGNDPSTFNLIASDLKRKGLVSPKAVLQNAIAAFEKEEPASQSSIGRFFSSYAPDLNRMEKLRRTFDNYVGAGWRSDYTEGLSNKEMGVLYRDAGRLNYRIGSINAVRNARLVSRGDGPRDSDFKAAFLLWEEGAKLDDPDCLYYLGVCYYLGKGVDKDKDRAIELWQKAANTGDGNKFAKAELARINDLEMKRPNISEKDTVEKTNGRLGLKLKDIETKDRILSDKLWINRAVSWIKDTGNHYVIGRVALGVLASLGVILAAAFITVSLVGVFWAIPLWFVASVAVMLIAAGTLGSLEDGRWR